MAWTDKLAEIIIGSVIVAGGGWLIAQNTAMSRSLGGLEAKLDAKLSETTGRIDRIAAVLPDVRIKLAKDELAKPITTAVLVTEPTRTASGKWVTGLHVLDTNLQTRNTYLVPVKGPNDRQVAWLASGAVVEADPNATSLRLLSQLAADAGTPFATPGFISPQNSYVLRLDPARFNKALGEVLKAYSARSSSSSFAAKLTSADKLSAELANNQTVYTVPAEIR